jgi:hypothetical protein
MKNPSNFFSSLKEATADRGESSQRAFERMALMKVFSGCYGLNGSLIHDVYSDEHNEEPLVELKGRVGNPEFDALFFLRRRGMDLAKVMLEPFKTPVYEHFEKLSGEMGLTYLGVVFPIKERHLWVMHNFGTMRRPGIVYHVLPSGDVDIHDIHIERATEFAKTRSMEE